MRELQVGMGVAAEKGENFSPFSGHNAPSRSVALLHGVGEKTVRMRAMRRRRALVYSDSVMAAMERENCSECSDWGLIRVRRALQQLLKAHFGRVHHFEFDAVALRFGRERVGRAHRAIFGREAFQQPHSRAGIPMLDRALQRALGSCNHARARRIEGMREFGVALQPTVNGCAPNPNGSARLGYAAALTQQLQQPSPRLPRSPVEPHLRPSPPRAV